MCDCFIREEEQIAKTVDGEIVWYCQECNGETPPPTGYADTAPNVHTGKAIEKCFGKIPDKVVDGREKGYNVMDFGVTDKRALKRGK